MAKRANGEGSVRQRPNGRWEGRWSYVDPMTGERVRRSFYGATAKEARAKMREAMDRVQDGRPAVDASVTLAAWIDQWCETALAASSRRESTKELSRTLLTKHVKGSRIADVRLDRLRPSHIDTLIVELRGRTRTRKGPDGEPVEVRALADSSIQRVFRVLRSCLDDAVRDGLLARNPAAQVKEPSAAYREARHLSPAEVGAILTAAKGTRYWSLFAVIAGTGIRKGEALALRWRDVDFEAGTITIRGTLQRVGGELVVSEPKTAKSRRVLAPAVSVMAILQDHRKQQVVERMKAANIWDDAGFVFTTETGRPMDGRNVLRAFTTATGKAGVEGATVHTLRHSAATALLDSGVHLKAVSELLGHSGTRITADTYAHLTTTTARRAMDSLGDVLGL